MKKYTFKAHRIVNITGINNTDVSIIKEEAA